MDTDMDLDTTTPTTPTTPPPPSLSAVDCYTCRRRRVRCDRVLPACAKCARTQLDCLGYKKPLVWNKGVASRGKMMGKTFPVPVNVPRPVVPVPVVLVASKQQSRSRSQLQLQSHPKSTAVVVAPGWRTTPDSEEVVEATADTDGGELWSEGEASSSSSSSSSPPRSPYGAPSPDNMYSLSRIMPDFFVELGTTGRYYLDYFDKRVCRDFLLFEKDGDNPYRNLLPLAAQHPPFLHAALAVAARHHANNCNLPETHALVYKGRAYRHLYSALQTQTAGVTEPFLAAMLLFLFFEALDSGKDTWKIHLGAARRLIGLSGGMRGIKAGMSPMLSVLVTHVAAIDIIGRSLCFAAPDGNYQPWGGSLAEVFAGLEEAEEYTFLGCPAELLKAILCINLLDSQRRGSSSTPPRTPPQLPTPPNTTLPHPETLLASIRAFSPELWLQTLLPMVKLTDKRSLAQIDPIEILHHASAYKCAVHILAAQVLSPPLPQPTAAAQAALTDECIVHLSCLPRASVMWKGALWPVFIAGTGATSEGQRDFVRVAINNIWSMLPQFNVRNAGTLLEEMWREADRGETDWRGRLGRGGINWLFV